MDNLIKKLSDDEIKNITDHGAGDDAMCNNNYLWMMCTAIGWKFDSGSCGYIWENCGPDNGGGSNCGTCTCR